MAPLRRTARVKPTVLAVLVTLLLALFPLSLPSAIAATSISYDFDSAGDLTSGFDSYVSSGTVIQSATGGIGNSGAIHVQNPHTADAVFTSKASYSLGPVGSTYTFSADMQSIGNGGYSGMGFTSLAPAAGTTVSSGAFRPSDALGISVHGGGFIFHNGSSNAFGSWNADNAGIVTITKATISDLLNSGSPDKWYRVFLVITRDSATTFDMRVEVWPILADGSLITPSGASAIFELRDQANATLTSAASIKTYLNFSGWRVYYFDNYRVSLTGGSTVIQAGAPVVLTTAVAAQTNVVALDGSVTADGGTSVTERGFVYGTSTDPTISDFKVPSGTGIGSFTEITPQLPNGTYYFRAYATNSTGTSYGVTQSVTIAGSSVQAMPGVNPAVSPSSSASSASVAELANTGSGSGGQWQLAVTLTALIGVGASLVLLRRRQIRR